MEVVTATPIPKMGGSNSPFRDHDVREWSRLDTISGALERARLETDSWTASTNDACHKYGKVLDTRARTTLDGSLAAASRQFEVFQSKSNAGTTRVQLVKTQTISSNRWSNSNQGLLEGHSNGNLGTSGDILSGFESLQLAVNPLDLTSQKSKASVGRSVTRRPPTRKQREASSPPKIDVCDPIRQHFSAAHNLNRVSRLCHQIHETAVRHAFGVTTTPSISERESGDGSASGVEIVEIESTTNTTNSSSDKAGNNETNRKESLARTKSTSSENLNQIQDKENQSDFEDLETWRRESKVRRSLQFPKQNKTQSIAKPPDLPESSVSVRKIREELEKGRRLSTALRNSSLDLVTLDQIIQSVSSNSSTDKSSSADENVEENFKTQKKTKQKRNSFVTVESIKEVKNRLRRTSSPINYNLGQDTNEIKKEDLDDDFDAAVMKDDQFSNQSRVKSYVYGMENSLQQNKTSLPTTGSLESRSKMVNGTTNHKNEDWYNRRKSYGFEKVHGHEENNGNSLKSKKPVESSTDSGICRSSELVPCSIQRKSDSSDTDYSPDNNKTKQNGIQYGKVRQMTSIFNQKKEENNGHLDDLSNPWTKRLSSSDWNKLIDPTTKDKKLSNLTVTLTTNKDEENDVKRHSIACDDFNYAECFENRFRKTSLNNSTDQLTKSDQMDESNRKTKKVEFCKTEIHFAAETGKVKIVETDEKPPPSQNFRRRRRNSGPTINYNNFSSKNGLSVTHFGDNSLHKNESFEKMMFGISDDENSDSRMSPELLSLEKDESRVPPIYSETKNTSDSDFSIKDITKPNFNKPSNSENSSSTECDNIKGILKNKPIKPKPYLLGDIPLSSDSDGETHPWNIKPPIRMFDDVHSKFKSAINKESTKVYTDDIIDFKDGYSKCKSTVNKESIKEVVIPKYQTSLKTVRPTKFPEHLLECDKTTNHRYSEGIITNLRVSPVKNENRPNSWSAMDTRINFEEKINFSSKVNVKDQEENVWVSARDAERDSKPIMNKGLVVRIGNENSISKHTLCSKMSTEYPEKDTNKITTTKITIDVSPCLTIEPKPRFTYVKYQRSQNDSFKSTPLVLNTIRSQNQRDMRSNNKVLLDTVEAKSSYVFNNQKEDSYKSKVAVFKDISKDKIQSLEKFNNSNVSNQLESLRKLYENGPSDSDADQEVQLLMSKSDNKEFNLQDKSDDTLISSSWERVNKLKLNKKSQNNVTSESKRTIKEDSSSWRRVTDFKSYGKNQSSFVKVKPRFDHTDSDVQKGHPNLPQESKSSLSSSKSKLSPQPLRKTSLPSHQMSNPAFFKDVLTSPSLVTKSSVPNYAVVNKTGKNIARDRSPDTRQKPVEGNNKYENVIFKQATGEVISNRNFAREEEDKEYEPIVFKQTNNFDTTRNKTSVRDNSPTKQKYEKAVLRQPKESQMSYFGVKSEQKLAAKVKTINNLTEDKPDLLQHYNERAPSPKRSKKPQKPVTRNIVKDPPYENVNFKGRFVKKEFDSSILDELTEAADQILQAVNCYPDEDLNKNRFSSDDEHKTPLDTISETKSWKNSNVALHARKATLASAAKVRVKRTSSNSSVESLNKDRRESFGKSNERQRRDQETRSGHKEMDRKKALSDSSSTKTSTKATRRIQRACSREALLQSHGSSSEDLPVHVESLPLRKPRLMKKTKTSQLAVNTGIEIKRPERERKKEILVGPVNKTEESIVNKIPEIKHRTAVSALRNITTEKSSRERSRARSEDRSSKYSSKKDSSKATPKGSSRSTSKQSYQPSSRLLDPSQKETNNVTQHRISTANIKKCKRAEVTKTKH